MAKLSLQSQLESGEKKSVKGKLDKMSFLIFMLDNNTFREQKVIYLPTFSYN